MSADNTSNSTTTDAPDWNAIYALVPPEPPDAYHWLRKSGAVKYSVEFGQYEIPGAHETWWSTFSAYCWCSNYSSDQYHFETLVLSYVRCVQEVAASFLDKRRGRFRELYAAKQVETIGADLLAEGLVGVIEALKRRPSFHVEPDGKDEMDQLKQYVCRAARNKMVDYVKMMYPKKWCSALHGSWESGELVNERKEIVGNNEDAPAQLIAAESENPTYTKVRRKAAWAAVRQACTQPLDKAIVRLWSNGEMSQEEIGKRIGLSRDQVQRRLKRIQRTAETLLGLSHVEPKKRKRRKSSESGGVNGQQDSTDLLCNLAD